MSQRFLQIFSLMMYYCSIAWCRIYLNFLHEIFLTQVIFVSLSFNIWSFSLFLFIEVRHKRLTNFLVYLLEWLLTTKVVSRPSISVTCLLLAGVYVTPPQSPLSAYTLRINNARVHSIFQSAHKFGLIDVTWRIVIYLREICSKKARTKVFKNSKCQTSQFYKSSYRIITFL